MAPRGRAVKISCASPLGPGNRDEAFDAAQRGFLGGALGDGHPVAADAAIDLVEGVVVVELPAQGDDVLGGSAPQQEAAFVVVEAESHDVGQAMLVEMHADGVAAEAAPVGELLGFDDDVAEVDVAEHDQWRVMSRETLTRREEFG